MSRLLPFYRTGAVIGGGAGNGRFGPIVWTLSDQWDFSASGLQEGDYGLLVLSGGPVLLRYKVMPIAAGAGGGTVPMWIPPAAYGQAGLEVDCYAVGTESDAQLGAQALGVTETNTGTVSSVSDYTRLDAPAVGSGSSIAQLTMPVITGASKWWITCEMRGSVTGNGAAGIFQLSSEPTQYTFGQIAGLGAYLQALYWVATWVVVASGLSIRGGGSLLPAVTPWTFHALTGPAITDLVETSVDGTPCCVYRRNADGATTASNMSLTLFASGATGGAAGRFEFRRFYRIRWTG